VGANPSASPGGDPLGAALSRLGLSSSHLRHPVLRSASGELVSFALLGAPSKLSYGGVLLVAGGAELVGPPPSNHAFSEAQGLEGVPAQLADLLAEAVGSYLERAEGADGRLAELQGRGRRASVEEVWSLEREVSRLRGVVGRAVVAVAELARLPSGALPGIGRALPPLESELQRVQDLTRSVQQGLSDLILMRNAEESNRLAETANELAALSNRVAELQNVSNIRMLGITYIALILAIVGAVVLIPNTAATILGMPSAGWVPGLWVDVILFALALVPLTVVFGQRWVRTLLKGFSGYEFRVVEGMGELPETVSPNDSAPARKPPADRT